MFAYRFADALYVSDRLNLEQFVSMQNHFNLVYREEECEMLRICDRDEIGVIPWSPLARGFLARPHRDFLDSTRGRYMDNTQYAERIDTYRANGGETINERVQELAAEKNVTMTQISLAWLLHKETVDAPIIGTTSIEHLEGAVEALEIRLTDSEIEHLEEPYGPVGINGHE